MIRFLLRLIGFLILAGGFVALVIDGARSIAVGALSWTSAETTWSSWSPATLAKTRTSLASVPGLDQAFAFMLSLPAFAPFVVIGVLLMLLGRRRRRGIGVAP
ncbi:hypothetical protein ACFQI3_16400 [Hansschlegelia quercus]|uniref:PetM family of cytochrome b6f complex subunit 7 n=1 Tax=Hansschlegelia quercus TaxID=2528245 RepID=A0A4Q9GNG8_9HYPH|nr:hypothetical protein [Hansschlegelia quercus]TBN52510.1 hypothetical protein EYR15_11800 [Hansschlegelia quercus]